VEGVCSHHCANPALHCILQVLHEYWFSNNVYEYIEFNREQAKAKKCLKDLMHSDCTFSPLIQEALDLDFGEYNPFCPNRRDPGATGKDQCDGVRDLDNPLNAAADNSAAGNSAAGNSTAGNSAASNSAAGLIPSVLQALMFSFVSLLLFVKI